jgi:hypothetical protein
MILLMQETATAQKTEAETLLRQLRLRTAARLEYARQRHANRLIAATTGAEYDLSAVRVADELYQAERDRIEAERLEAETALLRDARQLEEQLQQMETADSAPAAVSSVSMRIVLLWRLQLWRWLALKRWPALGNRFVWRRSVALLILVGVILAIVLPLTLSDDTSSRKSAQATVAPTAVWAPQSVRRWQPTITKICGTLVVRASDGSNPICRTQYQPILSVLILLDSGGNAAYNQDKLRGLEPLSVRLAETAVLIGAKTYDPSNGQQNLLVAARTINEMLMMAGTDVTFSPAKLAYHVARLLHPQEPVSGYYASVAQLVSDWGLPSSGTFDRLKMTNPLKARLADAA